MIKELIGVLGYNLSLSFVGAGLFIIVWSCNVVSGLFYNIGLNKMTFSFNKIKESLLKMIAIIYTTVGLVIVSTIFPAYVQQIGFAIPTEFVDFFNIFIILGAFATPISIYFVDAVKKLKDILLNQVIINK